MPHKKQRFLFLLKKNSTGYDSNYNPFYTNNLKVKSGLGNSAHFISDAVKKYFNIETKVETCIDANSIDKELHLFKPDVCFIEAIWVTVEKMNEIAKLYPSILFIVRVHSKTTFLANEGVAVGWLKGYEKIKNVFVSFNNLSTNDEFNSIGFQAIYLPNIYEIKNKYVTCFEQLKNFFNSYKKKKIIDIGCFGAIRPMKNQLLQAVAAIRYAEKYNKQIRFHINGSRTEQKGENVLKNLRALFVETEHQLVEHDWLNHEDFLTLISKMDIGLQVSLSESFNIVTADFISQHIPVIVSKEINWVADISKVNTDDSLGIADKIDATLYSPNKMIKRNLDSLIEYQKEALIIWFLFIKNFKEGNI